MLREEPVCRYCGVRPSTTADHILPLSKFPHLAHVRANLAGACRRCNGSKHDRILPRRTPSTAVTQLKW